MLMVELEPSADCSTGTFPSVLAAAPATAPAGTAAVAAAATAVVTSCTPSGVFKDKKIFLNSE